MNGSEAVLRRLDTLRLLPDLHESVLRLCREWMALMEELERLTPADHKQARALITEGFTIKDRLRYVLGPCVAVDHTLHLELHHQSIRLLGEGRPP